MYSAKHFSKRHNSYCIMFTESMNLCQEISDDVTVCLEHRFMWC